MSTLINMELDSTEAKEQVNPIADNPPRYPWGLSLCLSNDVLEKLGITDLPAVGTEIHIVCKGDVTRTSSYSGENETSNSVDIQITDMAIANLDALSAGSRLKTLYPSAFTAKK